MNRVARFIKTEMSTAITQDAIVDFLMEQGGRVKNSDLIDHFKHVFPEEPASRASTRDMFKKYVDNVAFVKVESGDKWVCLKKRYRVAKHQSVHVGVTFVEESPGTKSKQDVCGPPGTTQPGGAALGPDPAPRHPSGARQERACPTAASAKLPGSGYGNVCDEKESRVRPTCRSLAEELPPAFTCVVDDNEADMGISGSSDAVTRESSRGSCVHTPPSAVKIPEVVLSEYTADGSRGSGSGPARSQDDTTAFVKPSLTAAGTGRAKGPVSPQLTGPQSEVETEREPVKTTLIDSFPQVRRCTVPRSPSLRPLSSLTMSSDGNASPPRPSPSTDDMCGASSPTEEVGGASLDPLEHQWMLACAAGDWAVLQGLLAQRPALLHWRDFITGFSCLHWAARRGQAVLLVELLGHAPPPDVDARASGGYTPLHLAAMHGHRQAVALLAGAYDADVRLRDHSGWRACQYLPPGTPPDLRDLAGGGDGEGGAAGRDGGAEGFDEVRPRRRLPTLGKLQKIQARASLMVHSASFSGPDRRQRSVRGPPRPRPSSTLSG